MSVVRKREKRVDLNLGTNCEKERLAVTVKIGGLKVSREKDEKNDLEHYKNLDSDIKIQRYP